MITIRSTLSSVIVSGFFGFVIMNSAMASTNPLASPNGLHVIEKGERGNLLEVRLPSQKGGFDVIQGYLLPMEGSVYEGKQIGKFKEGLIRFVSMQAVVLNRVAGTPPASADDGLKRNVLLGVSETFVTNWHFKGLSDAMKNLALLPEWYKQFGAPNQVVEILVPKGTEMYIGHAEEQKTTEENVAVQVRNNGKKERTNKKIYNVSAGGGVQLLIPRKSSITGGEQLGLKDIVNTYPLKNDLQNKGGYADTNVEKRAERFSEVTKRVKKGA